MKNCKILHLLDHSLPQQSGYASRSHAILRSLTEMGLDIDVITGPKHGESEKRTETIDGIHYQRTPVSGDDSFDSVAGQLRTISRLRQNVKQQYPEGGPDLIHAHSPCLNGLAALGLGIPLVYEMRSSWEDAAVSVGTTHEGSARYRLSRALENIVLRRADQVTVICQGLRDDLIGRGIAEDKITIVPNALHDDMFVVPGEKEVEALKARFGLVNNTVIGYFGSFFEWEGVDDLIMAFQSVAEELPDARLLIAGGGRQEQDLASLVSDLKLGEKVIIAGRLPQSDMAACYASADVMAYPRKPDRLTNMVTPLKPLESMAQGTPVIASNVAGHKELVVDQETGILFEAGNVADLAQKLVALLQGPEQMQELSARALRFVQKERRWKKVAEAYIPVYEKLAPPVR